MVVLFTKMRNLFFHFPLPLRDKYIESSTVKILIWKCFLNTWVEMLRMELDVQVWSPGIRAEGINSEPLWCRWYLKPWRRRRSSRESAEKTAIEAEPWKAPESLGQGEKEPEKKRGRHVGRQRKKKGHPRRADAASGRPKRTNGSRAAERSTKTKTQKCP